MKQVLFVGLSLLLNWSASAQTPVTWQRTEHDKIMSVKTSRAHQPIQFDWQLLDTILAGQWLRVRCGSLNYLSALRFESIFDPSGKPFEIEHQHSQKAQNENWAYFVQNPFLAGWKTPQKIEKSALLVFKGTLTPQRFSGLMYFFRIEAAETWDGPWRGVSPWLIIETSSSTAEHLSCILRQDGRVMIQYTDEFGNPAALEKPVELAIKDAIGTALGSLTTSSAVTVYTIDPKASNSLWVEVSDSKGLTAVSNHPMVSSLDGAKVWFGDIHVHTEFSGDGVRPVAPTLESARDELGHDFIALADHMIFFNHYKTADYFDLIDRYHSEGTFVTLLGCEVSCPQGHVNLYFPNRQLANPIESVLMAWVSDPAWEKPNSLSFGKLFEAYQPGEILVVPHHPNTTSGPVTSPKGLPFWRNFDWRNVDVRYSPVAEIVQQRGCFETEAQDADWRVIAGGYGSSLQSALMRGLRVGFVGGSDNHFGWASRDPEKNDFTALTAIYAKQLTRAELFEAMRQRRTYATSGTRIAIDFYLNDQYPMGSIVSLSPRTKRAFTVRIVGTTTLDRVEIVSQGAVLAQMKCDGSRELTAIWTDPRPDAPIDNCYYYLRVRQKDGHCAWTSPIWIDYAPDVAP